MLVAGGIAPFMWLNGKVVYLSLFLASFGLGMFCISAMVLLNEAVPVSLKGAISGVFYLLWGLGFFLVPPGLTQLGASLGYGGVFAFAAVVVLVELFALRIKPADWR